MGHDKARATYRRAVAVELRQQGYSYDEIAEVLEYRDRSGAWRAVMRALRGREVTAVDRYRMVRYAELEGVHRASWPRAELGDLTAVSRCLSASEERMRLLGLT